jgi:hypothetical protein
VGETKVELGFFAKPYCLMDKIVDSQIKHKNAMQK